MSAEHKDKQKLREKKIVLMPTATSTTFSICVTTFRVTYPPKTVKKQNSNDADSNVSNFSICVTHPPTGTLLVSSQLLELQACRHYSEAGRQPPFLHHTIRRRITVIISR